jgi:hypothetical protein
MNKYRTLSIFVVLAMLFSFANVSPASAATTTAVTLQEGTATWSQDLGSYLVDKAIDGIIDDSGWAIHPYQGTNQTAVWETSSDIDAVQLDFELHQFNNNGDHELGRFRLSYTTDDRSTFADGLDSGGDVTANWTVLTGATISSSCACGETFTILPDNSILVGGANPQPTVYSVKFVGSFIGVTGIRLEALTDPSLPNNGPGRAFNGNFALSEITLEATPPTTNTIPTNLCAGDQYRLVFVTDDAISSGVYHNQTLWSNIETYNDFVTTQANNVLELSQLGTTWKVIGSTTSVSARMNTGTDPSTTGVPIYSVANTLIAENNADLWDGSIANPIEMTQTGVLLPAGTQIITGTHFDGLQSYHSKYGWATFGSDGTGYGIRISFGLSGNIDTTWINNLWYPFSAPIYAMSGVLTVPIDAVEGAGCDSELPTAAATQSPDANGLGWNNTDVTVTWTWSDEVGGSGIDNAACTTSSTSTGEGELTLTATCKDLAGNEGSASYTVKVDQTLPVADAGSDQSIHAGYTVNLDGGASSDDNTLPEALSYNWSFDSTPAGNTATLNNANTATPSFTPNVSGAYVVQLIVTDDADNDSELVFVTLSSLNMAPTADATATPMLPLLGQSVTLDGSTSTDPDGDAIYYQWAITSKPVGSAASLANANSAVASITPDVSGTYEMTLTVSDFLEAGAPVTVSFVASTAEEFSQVQIIEVSTVVTVLEPGEITTAGNQNAFGNFLTNTMEQIQKGNLDKAIADLERAIARTDGCALRGAPDGNGAGMDWVTTCDAQASIYGSLVAALEALQY